jgi:hypothetical protein
VSESDSEGVEVVRSSENTLLPWERSCLCPKPPIRGKYESSAVGIIISGLKSLVSDWTDAQNIHHLEANANCRIKIRVSVEQRHRKNDGSLSFTRISTRYYSLQYQVNRIQIFLYRPIQF